MTLLICVLGLVVGALAGAWWAGRQAAQDPFVAYLRTRVAFLEAQIDGMHQRGLVAPVPPSPEPERPAMILPPSVESALLGFEDPEVRDHLRGRALDDFARVPDLDPDRYVADLLRDP